MAGPQMDGGIGRRHHADTLGGMRETGSEERPMVPAHVELLLRLKRFLYGQAECTSPDGHRVDEFDPMGGWWCANCDGLYVRTPTEAELTQ